MEAVLIHSAIWAILRCHKEEKYTVKVMYFHYFSPELLMRRLAVPLEGGAGSGTEFPTNVPVPPTTDLLLHEGWSVVRKCWKGKTGIGSFVTTQIKEKRKRKNLPWGNWDFLFCPCLSWKGGVVLVINYFFHDIFRFLDHAFLWHRDKATWSRAAIFSLSPFL